MLWAGVPVVTYSGRTFASRVAGSLLQAIGLPENVCASVQAYEEKVMELAQNAVLRQAVRERVQQARLTAPLFNGATIAREIESLYERMWERAVAGLPPDHLLPQA
jgi:predicted O-linked N-acetylglucosamine transferase (SPINDLY family)